MRHHRGIIVGLGEPDRVDRQANLHFVIGKKVQVIGPDGKVLTEADVKKNAKVHLRLVEEGDHVVVDKINVEEK